MENTLNAIKNMPLLAAYYLGKRDSWQQQLDEDLNLCKAGDYDSAILKSDYYMIDIYNDKFCQEMGWL